jgi:PleD family two-component response regulator
METHAVRRVCIPIDSGARDPSRQSVLLVSDDGELRAAAVRVLERDGYDVTAVAHSGHALLVCLTAARVDVLATELSMDDTSGPALADRLRQHHPDLRAIYFANAGTPVCGNVLVRPFTGGDLVERLGAVVTARS